MVAGNRKCNGANPARCLGARCRVVHLHGSVRVCNVRHKLLRELSDVMEHSRPSRVLLRVKGLGEAGGKLRHTLQVFRNRLDTYAVTITVYMSRILFLLQRALSFFLIVFNIPQNHMLVNISYNRI